MNQFSDQPIWLALAQEALFWRLAGTIVGTAPPSMSPRGCVGPMSHGAMKHLKFADRIVVEPTEERLPQEFEENPDVLDSGVYLARTRADAADRRAAASPEVAKTLQKSRHVSKWWAQWWARSSMPPTKWSERQMRQAKAREGNDHSTRSRRFGPHVSGMEP